MRPFILEFTRTIEINYQIKVENAFPAENAVSALVQREVAKIFFNKAT